MKQIVRLTSVILIWSFLSMELAWANIEQYPKQGVDTLAPGLAVNISQFQQVFRKFIKADKKAHLPEHNNNQRLNQQFFINVLKEWIKSVKNITGIYPALFVFGSSRFRPENHYYKQAKRFAKRAAQTGFSIIHGGGPGIMEAVSKAASEIHRAYSIGLNMELPKQIINRFQDISFKFDYFFFRKLMFIINSIGGIAFPGGFGTMDEIFEVLAFNLRNPNSMLPMALVDTEFYSGFKQFINKGIDSGLIHKSVNKMLVLKETGEKAYEYLYQQLKTSKVKKKKINIRVFVQELFRADRFLRRIGPTVAIMGGNILPEENRFRKMAYELSRSFSDQGISIVSRGHSGIADSVGKAYEELEELHKEGRGLFISLEDGKEKESSNLADKTINFQYNFTLKIALARRTSQGFIFFPGGIDTLNMLFELLCLMKTEKVVPVPIVLVGKEFWGDLFDWIEKKMIPAGTIDKDFLSFVKIVDSQQEAEELILASGNDSRIIKKKENIPFLKFLAQTSVNTLSQATRYLIPERAIDFFIEREKVLRENIDSLKQRTREIFNIENIKMSLLIFSVYIIDKLIGFCVISYDKWLDFYYLFHPELDIVQIIKNRFPDKHIRVLDVGTGDEEFVKQFQAVFDKKNIKAEVKGIDIKSLLIVEGLKQKRNVQLLDIEKAKEEFGAASFDIITINASNRDPTYLILEAAALLRQNGFVILRMSKEMYYEVNFKDGFKGQMEKLTPNFKITVCKRKLYNLPDTAHRLQLPIIFSPRVEKAIINTAKHKKGLASSEKVFDLSSLSKRSKLKITECLSNGNIIEALRKLKLLKERGIDVDGLTAVVFEKAKKRAEELFEEHEYEKAKDIYEKMLEISDKDKMLYFYAAGINFILGNLEQAKQGLEILLEDEKEHNSPAFVLCMRMIKLMIESRKIRDFLDKGLKELDKEVIGEYSSSGNEKVVRYLELEQEIGVTTLIGKEDIIDFFRYHKIANQIYNSMVSESLKEQKRLEKTFAKKDIFLTGHCFAVTTEGERVGSDGRVMINGNTEVIQLFKNKNSQEMAVQNLIQRAI